MVRPRTASDEEILAAAARAVGQVGAARLTLAAVAREAGLAPATLVQRFGSKRGLLLALAKRGSGAGASPFEAARAANRSPLAALHEALGALAARVESPEQMANNLSFLQLDLTDPEFREHAAADARRTGGRIAALLTEAVAAGELRTRTDVPRLARAVQVAYNGSLILWSLIGGASLAQTLRADVDEVLEPHRPG